MNKPNKNVLKRDIEIYEKIKKGQDLTSLAVEYGLSYNTIVSIKNKMAVFSEVEKLKKHLKKLLFT